MTPKGVLRMYDALVYPISGLKKEMYSRREVEKVLELYKKSLSPKTNEKEENNMAENTLSSAQIERQKPEHRKHGKYAKVNPCYVCGKSAGVYYGSHHDTDGAINDQLLVLCKGCMKKYDPLPGKEAVRLAFGGN